MCLGRHGQLLSLILVTFHMFDSLICLSSAFNFHYLKIKFGCPSCTDKTVFTCPILMEPSGPLLCFLTRVGLSAFVVFCFEELWIERRIREGSTHLLVVCLKISMSLFFWCLSLCLLLSVSLSLCCHLSFRMKGLEIVQSFTVFSSLKWHLLKCTIGVCFAISHARTRRSPLHLWIINILGCSMCSYKKPAQTECQIE